MHDCGNNHIHLQCDKKRYGFGAFLFDCFMVLITAGLWLIWIFVREMRNR